MYNPERSTEPTVDELRYDHIDVSIISPDSFRAYLESDSNYKTLYTSSYSDDLPTPVREAQLGYSRNEEGIGIAGELHFHPSAIDPTYARTWQDIISGGICSRLADEGYITYSLPHELHDFHIQLSPAYTAHVQMETETEDCGISVTLEQTTDSQSELTETATTISDELELDTYQLFRQFTTVWAHAIDVVIDEYGTRRKGNSLAQITFATPDPNVLASDEPAAELQHPILESYTSSEKSLRMLGGLERPKQKMQSIIDTFTDPVGAKMYGITAGHFMLYGPPGTGKTSLVEALASEINDATLRHIPSNDIMAGTVGQSGINLSAIFDEAFAQTVPCILFFDEFDSIAGSGNNDSVSHIEVKKLLNQYIIEASRSHPHVVIAAATNLDQHQIEDTLTRSGRLEPIAVLKPNEHERSDIWAAVIARSYANFISAATLSVNTDTATIDDIQQFVPYANDINPLELAALTDEMTGADFEQILRTARDTCYRHYRSTGEKRLVDQSGIIDAIRMFGR